VNKIKSWEKNEKRSEGLSDLLDILADKADKCHNEFKLNSSTIDELGEGAWKDSGASSTRAGRIG